MDAQLMAEVWERLRGGGRLDGLGLARHEGRTDLRGLGAPQPTPFDSIRVGERDYALMRPRVTVADVRVEAVDFSGADLDFVTFDGCDIADCKFEKTLCRCGTFNGTSVRNTTFESADLRDAALGTIASNGRRNAFLDVDFTRTDLRGTIYGTVDFARCKFDRCKLKRVCFDGAVFVDCVFSGPLSDVEFRRRSSAYMDAPGNEMKNVSFAGARLMDVRFAELDLDSVAWPRDADHLVVDNYREVLKRVLARLEGTSDTLSRVMTAVLESNLRWAGPNQRVGCVSRWDVDGDEGFARIKELAQD
jgi:uncharacterized protein YjbI with pentapeptide repeats